MAGEPMVSLLEALFFDREKTDLGNLEWRDFALDFGANLAFRHAQIVKRLQRQPKLGAGSEVARQAQGGVGGDSALATYNFVHSARTDAEGLGEPIHTHAEGHEVVFLDCFSG